MAITDRNLQPGAKLVARYKGQQYGCEVVEKDGRLRYIPNNGSDFIGPEEGFKSPSAAGSAITGHACNGWVFWSVEGSEEAKPKARNNGNSKTANLTQLEDGRWFCSTCQAAFDTNELEPSECPEGHKLEEAAIA